MALTNTEHQRNYRHKLMEQAGRGKYVLDLDADPTNMCPLEYLLTVMNDPNVAVDTRMKAAIAAAPYVHVRAELNQPQTKKEEKEAAADEAANGKYSVAEPPRMAA